MVQHRVDKARLAPFREEGARNIDVFVDHHFDRRIALDKLGARCKQRPQGGRCGQSAISPPARGRSSGRSCLIIHRIIHQLAKQFGVALGIFVALIGRAETMIQTPRSPYWCSGALLHLKQRLHRIKTGSRRACVLFRLRPGFGASLEVMSEGSVVKSGEPVSRRQV